MMPTTGTNPNSTLGLTTPSTAAANPYLIDPSAKDFAGQNYQALTRDMWSSYVQNFMPYEQKLIDYARSPTVVGDAMNEASDLVDQSFSQQQGATQRRLKGLGLTLDPDEQAAADRSYGLSKSLADVTAQNVAGAQTRARQRSILGNPAPSNIPM